MHNDFIQLLQISHLTIQDWYKLRIIVLNITENEH